MAESLLDIVKRLGRSGRDETKLPARYDADHRVLWLNNTPVPFREGRHENREVLRSIAECIRELRSIGPNDPCPLRSDDLPGFARVLDVQARTLRKDLRRILCIDKKEAGKLLARLRAAERAHLG